MAPSELAQRAAQAKRETGEVRTARDLILDHTDEFQRAIGDQIRAEHFTRGVLTAISSNNDLAQATEQSLIASVLLAAQLKLEIGAGLNQFHLTPRKVKMEVGRDDRGRPEYAQVQVCVPIIGYQGFVALGYRHPKTLDFQLARVYEHDDFHRAYSTERGWAIDLVPAPIEDRGEYRGSIIRTKTVGGGIIETYMHVDDIERRRPEYTKEQTVRGGARAGETYIPNTPWKTNYESMADKTVMREHGKYIPKSIEMEQALALDGRVLKVNGGGEVEAALSDDEEFAEEQGS